LLYKTVANGASRGWVRLLDSSNYTTYTVKKDGTGASGNWGINITGSAGSVAWGNITGKPNYAGSSSAGGAANLANALNINNSASLANCLQYIQTSSQTSGNDLPTSAWWHVLKFNHGTGDTYYKRLLALDFHSNTIKTAYATTDGAVKRWDTLLSSDNYDDYALPLSGGILTGTLTLKRDSAPSLGTRIPLVEISYKNTDSTAWYGGSIIDVLGSGETSTNYNAYVRMGSPSGSTFITAGECSTSGIYSKIASSTDEKLYLLSDTNIYFYASCANDASSYTLAQTIEASKITAHVPLYGAVWNDYAEYRSGETTEPGKVVKECPDGILRITESRLEPGCEIISDTFGFAIGETDECKTPVATSGRVLAYPFEDRNTFELGQAVCSGPNGTVSKMTREEIMMYPERIIGTVSEIPEYEIWGTGNVAINGRIWIRIR
jgi:hypothetical protein